MSTFVFEPPPPKTNELEHTGAGPEYEFLHARRVREVKKFRALVTRELCDGALFLCV